MEEPRTERSIWELGGELERLAIGRCSGHVGQAYVFSETVAKSMLGLAGVQEAISRTQCIIDEIRGGVRQPLSHLERLLKV